MAENREAKHKREKQLNNKTKIFIKTQILALIVYSLLFILVSVIFFSINADASKGFYASAAAFAVSSFVCGYYAGYNIHKNGLLIGLLFSLPANVLVALISMLVNSFKIDFTALISFAILLICSMLGGIASVNTRLKKPR